MKPEGAQVTLRVDRWDGQRPEPGDFLRTRSGRCYRIDEPRLTVSALGGLRGPMTCTVLAHDAVQLGEPGVFLWEWTPRRR